MPEDHDKGIDPVQLQLFRRGAALPFEEGYPIVKAAVQRNPHLVNTDEVAAWCKRHARKLLAIVDNPER